ncbi:hypothetical protein DPMN_030134 [Dreissena polymorpha]|uniref:Uncharacterized protein n=1 Tax=Dreissena polymorpha TaxID=45954 RepID=A0A9D4LZD3_DREPO|nr:hypothetical protein DPMN_030134 [Dreissena polymorpha]
MRPMTVGGKPSSTGEKPLEGSLRLRREPLHRDLLPRSARAEDIIDWSRGHRPCSLVSLDGLLMEREPVTYLRSESCSLADARA